MATTREERARLAEKWWPFCIGFVRAAKRRNPNIDWDEKLSAANYCLEVCCRRYDPSIGSFRKYLAKTLRNIVDSRRGLLTRRSLIMRQSAQSIHGIPDYFLPPTETSPIDAMIEDEDILRLRVAMRRLEPWERELIQMRFFEGRTYRAIGKSAPRGDQKKMSGQLTHHHTGRILRTLKQIMRTIKEGPAI